MTDRQLREKGPASIDDETSGELPALIEKSTTEQVALAGFEAMRRIFGWPSRDIRADVYTDPSATAARGNDAA